MLPYFCSFIIFFTINAIIVMSVYFLNCLHVRVVPVNLPGHIFKEQQW